MEKAKLNRFIQKYSLGSLVESVKWEAKEGDLLTSFISDDKSVLGAIRMKAFESDNMVVGIYDTTKLIKMLSVLNNEVDFDITKVDSKPVSLNFKDGSTSIDYMLADLSVIPSVPDLKSLPDFDISIKLDEKFISSFIRSKNALQDENSFTFLSKAGKSNIVLGYSNVNTNRITINVDSNATADVSPISFSATYFKEILIANKDATTATLNISTQGLAHIHFEIGEYTSDYYLVEIAI